MSLKWSKLKVTVQHLTSLHLDSKINWLGLSGQSESKTYILSALVERRIGLYSSVSYTLKFWTLCLSFCQRHNDFVWLHRKVSSPIFKTSKPRITHGQHLSKITLLLWSSLLYSMFYCDWFHTGSFCSVRILWGDVLIRLFKSSHYFGFTWASALHSQLCSVGFNVTHMSSIIFFYFVPVMLLGCIWQIVWLSSRFLQ